MSVKDFNEIMINEKVKKAVISTMPPDNFDAILEACIESDKEVMIMNTKSKKANSFVKILASCAAVATIVIGGTVGYNAYMTSPSYVLGMDVNPSFSISVARNDTILDVSALNPDAQAVLSNLALEGTDFDVAMNALVGSMYQNGFISDTSNSILLSLEGNNIDEAKKAELTNTINTLFAQNNGETSVLFQEVVEDPMLNELATEYSISVGKAKIISEIIASDNTLTFDQLSTLTINELNLIAQSSNRDLGSDVTVSGTPTQAQYIGEQAATDIAVAHASLIGQTLEDFDIEFDVENGVFVYELDFDVNGNEYEYDIDALTGAVIKAEVDLNDDIDDDTDDIDEPKVTATLTEQAAIDAAVAHAAVDPASIVLEKVELDEDDNVLYYDIEFKVGNTEYEYEIDATTGAVIKAESDVDADDTSSTAPAPAPTVDYDDDDDNDDDDDDGDDDDGDDD